MLGRTKFTVLFSLLLAIIALSGCSEQARSEIGEKKILRVNNGSEPSSLHPGKAQSMHDSWVLDHTFEGLTKKTPEGEIVDGMAESWEVSEDGLTWVFFIKDDVKWSNGTPVTAHDFEYAWKYALHPNTASPYAYQFYSIRGAEALNSANADADFEKLQRNVGVKAVDEKTLQVTLIEPTPYFLDLTSFFAFYPIPSQVQKQNPDWALNARTFVSNGPFTLAEWNHRENLTLTKNIHYYERERVHLERVEMAMIGDPKTAWQMYRAGELDLAYPLPNEVQGELIASNAEEFYNSPDLALYFYNINTAKKPFHHPKIRKALSLAIDREALVNHVVQGGQKPAFSIVPPGINDVYGDFQSNSGALFTEDVATARQLLAEGLEEVGLDEMPTFSMMYNTQESHKKIAEAIQEMWRKNLGIHVEHENVEFQVKMEREHIGDYDISRSGWIGDYADPMTFLHLWASDSPHNDANWFHVEYDNWIKKAQTSVDEEERMEALHRAEEILIAEMPIIPIYFSTKPYMLKSYVKGVFTPINRQPQFMYADIDK